MKIKHLIFTMMIAASCAGSAPKEAAVPEVEINDGVMTPEVLLAFGRLSDPQLSPDGSKILYGVSYQNIKENNSLRNIYICNTDGSGKVQLTNEKKSVSCARWSKDGKLAYVEEPADEAVGAYFFQFHILDLNTGKDVFSWKPEEDPEEGSISQMFQDNKELFETELKKNGIIPCQFKLDGVAVPYIAEGAKVWMDKKSEESNFLGLDVIKEVKISCGTGDAGKVIYENVNNEEYNTTLDQEIAGTLKCPFQDMAAVMVKYVQRGYEGPPHVYHFYFVKAGK